MSARLDAADAGARLPVFTTPHLRREFRTLGFMMQAWCKGRHPDLPKQARLAAGVFPTLCEECAALLEYAAFRLEKCPYGEAKPTCANCPVHCYRKAPREQMREVMRTTGPGLLLTHPILSIRHLFVDGRRRVGLPGAHKRGEAGSAAPDALRRRRDERGGTT
ncbi:MAG: nitrous oxide-stimulated promoter family protein [Steroidobacteraceae bacterium]|jgi:hypothetical protein|nr:nitrous oxide-stimulated promoter family protein [Steroidobacteraceae bacterium]